VKAVLLALALGACALSLARSPAPAPAHAKPAPIIRAGEINGAPYLMQAPADWRGGVVVYAHGIQRGIGPGDVTAPPLGDHILDAGHAWIASGYREREYRPDVAVEDLLALRALFLSARTGRRAIARSTARCASGRSTISSRGWSAA
jgi:hypothetical protein